MKKKKTKKLSWIDSKKAVINFDHSQLVDIVNDLFQLSEENKTFLYARCLDGSESFKRYKNVTKIPKKRQGPFRKRLEKIMKSRQTAETPAA